VNLAGFRNVWQNTPCTVCHPAITCFALVPLNSVARLYTTTRFFTKTGVILHACVDGRRKDFFQGRGQNWGSVVGGDQNWGNVVFTTRN